jgi:hypothetical protein
MLAPDNIPHFLKGMHLLFTVSGSATRGHDLQDAGQLRHPDGVVTLRDFSFTIPTAMTRAGFHLIEVLNHGPQTHQMQLFKVRKGHTLKEVAACLQSMKCQPPVDDAGGTDALEPGGIGWMELNLRPGTYIAICLVPDLKTQKPHAALGMVAPFTVR